MKLQSLKLGAFKYRPRRPPTIEKGDIAHIHIRIELAGIREKSTERMLDVVGVYN